METEDQYTEHVAVIKEAHASLVEHEELGNIIREARLKMVEGEKEYGFFDPETNKEDLFQHMIEEYIDIINYSAMKIMKIKVCVGYEDGVYDQVIEQLLRKINFATIEVIRIKELKKKKEDAEWQASLKKQYIAVVNKYNEIQNQFAEREPREH